MTLDTALSKALYQGNGSATQFPFAFKVWDVSELLVTVSGNGRESRDVTAQSDIQLTDAGGIVTYPRDGAPLPEGSTLSIVRNMPFTQGIDLVSASRFDPQVIEDGLDQATAERQQLLEQLSRAVILPPTSEQSPEQVVEEIYAARDQAGQSAAEAAASAQAAEQSAGLAQASAQLAGDCRDQACECADRSEQARDVALEQTVTVNRVMETELAKINTIIAVNEDNQKAAVEKAKAWAESPEDAPVEVNSAGEPEYSARHWAEKSSQLMAGDASKNRKGVVRVGDGIDVSQGVISVPPTPLATAATPGLVQPDNVTCAVNEAGVLSGISMFFNTRLVLTTSGIFTVPVSTWYKIVIVGAGGAGGSTYAGGSAGGHSSFGDLLTARGGSGGGGCAYCGGGGGYAGDVVTGIVFLEAETKISFIVGAGGFPQSGGSATAPIQATGTNIGYYASNVGGTGANNGTAIFYYNDGKDLCGGNGGTGGRNGSGYGGGGGGAAGYVAIPYAGQGLYRPVGGYGCDSGTAGAAYTGTNYAYLAGGNGGDGAIILEFYDPNKPTA